MELKLGGQPNTILRGLCSIYFESQESPRSCCDFRYSLVVKFRLGL